MTGLAEHVAARDAWARSARGPLALVNAQHVDRPQPVWPVAGQWAPAPGGLTVTAAASDGVVVDGVPVDGTVLVAGDAAVVPSTVAFADGLAGTVHGRTEHAQPLDGQTLRVWDPASDAVSRFARIARFAPRPEGWVTTGRYEPRSGLEAPGHLTDAAGDPLPIAGTITTTVDGVTVRLTAARSAPFHGRPRLQLIVQDATSALPEDDPGSSYSMGRFLYLDEPDGAADVTLDWEWLVLPPCAFSYQYACPVPPEENRIPVPLTAGERHPVDATGAVLH